MVDLRRLHEIEELVQDSVFHPSPCRRLRERRDSRRGQSQSPAACFAANFHRLVGCGRRSFDRVFRPSLFDGGAAHHAVSNSAAIRSESDLSCPIPETPVPSQISPAPGQSYGEWLYSQGGNPGNTVLPATEGDRSQRANSPPNRGL